jgi:hypothetical protein
VKSTAQDASDAALLSQARQRAAKLLADLQRQQSQWESAGADSAVAAQGSAAVSDVIATMQQLTAAINADCARGQVGVDHIDEANSHDE